MSWIINILKSAHWSPSVQGFEEFTKNNIKRKEKKTIYVLSYIYNNVLLNLKVVVRGTKLSVNLILNVIEVCFRFIGKRCFIRLVKITFSRLANFGCLQKLLEKKNKKTKKKKNKGLQQPTPPALLFETIIYYFFFDKNIIFCFPKR